MRRREPCKGGRGRAGGGRVEAGFPGGANSCFAWRGAGQPNLVPGVGVARTLRSGNDITMVAWGNTVGLCLRAADALACVGVVAEVIDLRCLAAPLDIERIIESARRTGKLLVAHEDIQTAGLGAEIVARVSKRSRHRCASAASHKRLTPMCRATSRTSWKFCPPSGKSLKPRWPCWAARSRGKPRRRPGMGCKPSRRSA